MKLVNYDQLRGAWQLLILESGDTLDPRKSIEFFQRHGTDPIFLQVIRDLAAGYQQILMHPSTDPAYNDWVESQKTLHVHLYALMKRTVF